MSLFCLPLRYSLEGQGGGGGGGLKKFARLGKYMIFCKERVESMLFARGLFLQYNKRDIFAKG